MTIVAALALPGTAFADVSFQAVDIVNQWTPDNQTIKVGETVTWSFAGTTSVHNVKSDAGAWSLESGYGPTVPEATYTFTAPGVYTFYCLLHQSTMKGTVTVTDATGAPPPPPPPPP